MPSTRITITGFALVLGLATSCVRASFWGHDAPPTDAARDGRRDSLADAIRHDLAPSDAAPDRSALDRTAGDAPAEHGAPDAPADGPRDAAQKDGPKLDAKRDVPRADAKRDLKPADQKLDALAPPAKANGSSCSSYDQCLSGQCSGGVCCNIDCAGVCKSCKTGLCEYVAEGSGPGMTGSPCGWSLPCGQKDTCDGGGKCRPFVPRGSPCESHPTCGGAPPGNTLLLTGQCDGAGACSLAAAPIACSKYVCVPYGFSAAGCAKGCSGASQCVKGETCSVGKCGGEQQPLGTTCQLASECASGYCVEGRCCESACVGPCMTCGSYEMQGRCVAVTEGWSPPAGKNCPSSPATCGPDGKCDGNGACRTLSPKGTTCKSPACVPGSSSDAVEYHRCDGSGNCVKERFPCGAAHRCQPGVASCYGRCSPAHPNACRTGYTCDPATWTCK